MNDICTLFGHDRFPFFRTEHFHTYDILRYLLEAVLCGLLDKGSNRLSATASVIARVDAERGFADSARWKSAWEFLTADLYVLGTTTTTGKSTYFVSDDGMELLEELRRSRIDPQSTLFITGGNNDDGISALDRQLMHEARFRNCLSAILDLSPAHSVRRPADPLFSRERDGADGRHAATSAS